MKAAKNKQPRKLVFSVSFSAMLCNAGHDGQKPQKQKPIAPRHDDDFNAFNAASSRAFGSRIALLTIALGSKSPETVEL